MTEGSHALQPGHVSVQEVWEGFRLYHSRPRGIKDRLFRLERTVYEDFWALQDVSFEVEPGESFAVLGANGSGKSTLLKCLSGILAPDRGSLQVHGKVAGLLELGAGFHGDLSGRENIYLNGSILGLSQRQVAREFDKIVEFAGIENFIDTPVRNYSSGMYLRLGFAIAINVDPDVMLIDEILAVGDAAFQTKCFEKMHEFKRREKTIILVTHDLDSAVRLCDRAILLEHGRVVSEGATREVVAEYRRRVLAEESGDTSQAPAEGRRLGSRGAEILTAELLDEQEVALGTLIPNQVCTFRQVIRFDVEARNPTFGYMLAADDGTELFNSNTMWRGILTGHFRPGDTVEVRFVQKMPLLPGRYLITTAVGHEDTTQWYDWWDECLAFRVKGIPHYRGYVNLDPEVSFRLTNDDAVQQA